MQAARLDYLNAQNGLRQMWTQLMTLVGVDLPYTRLAGQLEGDTTPIEFDEALGRILKFSPDVQKAYANLRFEQITLKWQRVQPWPNLVVTGGSGYHAPSQRAIGTAQFQVQRVPIWNWNQGNIRAANAQVVHQQAEIRRVSLEIQSMLAMVYEQYLTALQHVESFQRVNLPELRRAYELTLDSYEDDRNTWGDVLITQRAYYMNRMGYVTHLMTWREAEVQIVGYLLHGGLMPAPPAGSLTAPTAASVSGSEMFSAPSAVAPTP